MAGRGLLAPVHIEPGLLSVPQMYGSAGEPSLLSVPSMLGPSRPVQFQGGGFSPLLAGPLALALMYPGMLDQVPATRSASGMIRRPPSEPSFAEAFSAARRAGLKEFEWHGKKYHTRYKEEMNG